MGTGGDPGEDRPLDPTLEARAPDTASLPRQDLPSFPGYEVQRELGRGGMGVVYRAKDLRRGEIVALKTLLWAEPAALMRFKQEFRSLADVAHRNLATLYELVAEDGRWFFTMELVEGEDFLTWVRGDPGRLRPALRQLAKGVAALHAGGRLHRDLKPSNVMVTRQGRVVILDFGLAAEVMPGGAHQSTQRHAVGTPAYMSPEQAIGNPVTPAADWYAFGTILYEALTGRLPFTGSAVEVLMAKQGPEPAPPSDLVEGVDPEMNRLCASLLRKAPEERAGSAEVLGALRGETVEGVRRIPEDRAPVGVPVLVGREPHLRALREAYDALRERRPVVAFVHGNSGMGKSALVQEFLDELARHGEAVILAGRCYERESVPYKALDGPIDALTRYLGRMPRAEAAALLPRDVSSLARVFPILGRVEAVAQAPPPAVEIPDPQEVRRRGFAGLREVFGRIADHRPLVVFVDDLQWGDADSAGLLATLLRAPEAPAFLFLGCYRREDEATSTFLEAFRKAGEGIPAAREVRVDPLSDGEAQSLATSLLAGRGASSEKAEAIAREAGGSPLFLHELTVHGDVAGEGTTLEDVIRFRVRSLSPEARRLVEVVAVSGGPVAQAPAAFAARLETGAQGVLATLRGSRLLRTKKVGDREDLDTYHDRVREAVLADFGTKDLQELHRRLGLALEAEGDADPEVLGVHLEGAGEAARAGAMYARAADASAKALAFDHASRLYRKAIELLRPEGRQGLSLVWKLGDSLANGGRCAESAPRYLEASAWAEGADSLDLRYRAAVQYLLSGNIEEWFRLVEPIQREIGVTLPKSALFSVLRVVWDLAILRLRGFGYRPRAPVPIPREEMLRLDVAHGFSSIYSNIHLFHGLKYHTYQLRRALRLGDPEFVSIGISRHLPYEVSSGLPGAKRRGALRSLSERLAREDGGPRARAYHLLGVGMSEFLLGNWELARGSLADAETLFREECVGSVTERQIMLMWDLMCLDFKGEFRELARRAPAHVRDAEERGNLLLATDLQTRVAYFLPLMEDQPHRSEADVEEAIRRWPRKQMYLQHFRWLEARTHLGLYREDSETCRRVLQDQWPQFRATYFLYVPLLLHVFLVLRARSSLLNATRDGTPSRRRFRITEVRRDARKLRKAEPRYASGWGHLLAAGVANVEGASDEARRELETAEGHFREAGMAAYIAVAKRRRGQLLKGDEGRRLIAESDAYFASQGIRNPNAWTRMYAPGFPD